MNELGKKLPDGTPTDRANLIEITEEWAGQRIDNFLFRVCKGVPKSHVYRILRSGETPQVQGAHAFRKGIAFQEKRRGS